MSVNKKKRNQISSTTYFFLLLHSMLVFFSLKSECDSKSLLNILADLNCAVVWIILIKPLVSNSLCQIFENHSKSFNYNWYYNHFHVPQLFQFSGKWQLFIDLFLFSLFSAGMAKSTWHVLWFLLINTGFLNIHGTHVTANIGCLNIHGTHVTANIGCLNIYGTHVTANNSITNNVVFFFVSDLKILYNNNSQSSITMPWANEVKIFCVITYLEMKSFKTVSK